MISEKAIQIWLKNVESDDRLHYEPANVFVNAPLALEQLRMETMSDTLRRVLGLPLCRHNKETGRWEEIK